MLVRKLHQWLGCLPQAATLIVVLSSAALGQSASPAQSIPTDTRLWLLYADQIELQLCYKRFGSDFPDNLLGVLSKITLTITTVEQDFTRDQINDIRDKITDQFRSVASSNMDRRNTDDAIKSCRSVVNAINLLL